MRVDIGTRRSGKTLRAIEWASKTDSRAIVTSSVNRAHDILQLSKRLGLHDGRLEAYQVVSIDQVRAGILRGKSASIWIDDVEAVLYTIFSSVDEIEGFSMSIGVDPKHLT